MLIKQIPSWVVKGWNHPFKDTRIILEQQGDLHYLSLTARVQKWAVRSAIVTVGGTRFRTAAFAKNGLYALPLKDAVRRAEGIELGDVVSMLVEVAPKR